MMEWLACGLLIAGSFFIMVAGVGLVRLPDLYTRMHAAAKAGSFGVGLLLAGYLALEPNLSVLEDAILIILFIYFTAPVGGHLISRAGYHHGAEPVKDGPTNEEGKKPDSADKGV